MAQSAKHVKIRRKDLRKPDEFETLTGEGIAWAQKHQAKFIVGVVGVLVVGVAVLLVVRSRSARNQEASIQFQQAAAQLDSGSAAVAATQFQNLEQSASSTPFGQLAGLYRGHALLKQGDGAGAANAYTQYLRTASAPDYLRQQALVGLGNAKQLGNDTSGAHDAYLQAEKLDGPAKDEAALGVARMLEAQGQTDQARAIYARLAKEAPEGWVRAAAAEKAPGVAADEPSASADAVVDVQ
jgi:predicted negative regulator of RcsB-dependent stress response